MREFRLSICLSFLTLLFSACSVSQMDSLTSNKKVLVNESLPKIENLKSLSDMSNISF